MILHKFNLIFSYIDIYLTNKISKVIFKYACEKKTLISQKFYFSFYIKNMKEKKMKACFSFEIVQCLHDDVDYSNINCTCTSKQVNKEEKKA